VTGNDQKGQWKTESKLWKTTPKRVRRRKDKPFLSPRVSRDPLETEKIELTHLMVFASGFRIIRFILSRPGAQGFGAKRVLRVGVGVMTMVVAVVMAVLMPMAMAVLMAVVVGAR
jgi:hypothetical protein